MLQLGNRLGLGLGLGLGAKRRVFSPGYMVGILLV